MAKPQLLPRGRLLYKTADELRYVVVERRRFGDLWLVEEGWSAASDAAGPFPPGDALRALRLANTLVPEGCELGPWTTGLSLFNRSRLPAHPNEWLRVDETQLPPSVSRYSDLDDPFNERCCSPAQKPPRVRWRPIPGGGDTGELLHLVSALHADLHPRHGGSLARPWNAHPAGSPVLATTTDLTDEFAIIDLPPR